MRTVVFHIVISCASSTILLNLFCKRPPFFVKNRRGHPGQKPQLRGHPAVEGPARAQLRRPGGQVHRQHAERREGPQQDRPGGLGPAQWRDGQPVQVRAKSRHIIVSDVAHPDPDPASC